MNIEDAYEYFLNRGCICFPINGKVPTVKLAGRTESVMPREGQNLGVMTRGLVVVDIDSPEAATPADFPETFTVKTARGWHLYYRADPNRPVASCKLDRNPLIDVKAHPHHYVVGPGSRHHSGAIYEYLGGTLQPVPSSVLDRCTSLHMHTPEHPPITGIGPTTPEVMRPWAESRVLEPMRRYGREGNRSNQLFKSACRFYEGAALGQFGMDVLYDLATIAHTAGLSTDEIKSTIDSASRRAKV